MHIPIPTETTGSKSYSQPKHDPPEHPEEQKTAKTTFRGTPKSRKQQKPRIPWTESSKNGENCGFRGQNHQKTEKTAFPHPGEKQNHPKTAFPNPGEKQKHPKTALPHPGENQKQLKTAFPNFGKDKITRKLRFPTLGKAKTPENCVSQLWERQNHSKTALPNFGKDKNTRKLRFGAPRRAEKRKKPLVARKRNTKSPNFRSSLVSETQNHAISARRS